MASFGFGFTYVCPCGTALQTENGLDFHEQLVVIKYLADKHRYEHRMRAESLMDGDPDGELPLH